MADDSNASDDNENVADMAIEKLLKQYVERHFHDWAAQAPNDPALLSDNPPSSRQTHTPVNAKAGDEWSWQSRRLNLNLMGKNLTNEHCRPSQSTRSRPRKYLLTLSARFR